MEGRDKSSFWWSSDGAQEAREAAARGHDSRCLKTARASRINSRTISSHLEIESDISSTWTFSTFVFTGQRQVINRSRQQPERERHPSQMTPFQGRD